MTDTRKRFIYKVGLRLSNGKEHIVTVAAYGKETIESVINANKAFYSSPTVKVEGISGIYEELNPFTIDPQKYEEELMYADITEPSLDDGKLTVEPTVVRTVGQG